MPVIMVASASRGKDHVMTDKQSRIREQEDIIRNAWLNTEITDAEERAINDRAWDIIAKLEDEPELTELPEPDQPYLTDVPRSNLVFSRAGINYSTDKMNAALREYLRSLIAETAAAGASLDEDTCTALLAYQAERHREPLRRQQHMARSNRLFEELFCFPDCQIDHEHKQSYRDILRARPKPPKPARRRSKPAPTR
jgi:hypothetical protein